MTYTRIEVPAFTHHTVGSLSLLDTNKGVVALLRSSPAEQLYCIRTKKYVQRRNYMYMVQQTQEKTGTESDQYCIN